MIIKRIKKIAILLAVATLFAGCSSSKNVDEVPVDSYSDVTEVSVEEEEKVEKSGKSTTTATKKTKKTFGETITTGIANFFASKFFEYDETTLSTGGIFGGIKQRNAITVVYPKTKTAGFGSPMMGGYYYILFDAEGREKLKKAVDQYFSDFENKRLDRKSKKTFKSYGYTKADVFWGTVKTSSPNNATGKLYFGYRFEKNSPYFTFYMYPADNKIYDGPDSGHPEESATLEYYFTKAQAKALLACLEEERISEALYNYEVERYGLPEDADEYGEYDDYENVEEYEEAEVQAVED